MQVYFRVPRAHARRGGHKIITTKWIDTDKGDRARPNCRSRLVGREIKKDKRLDLSAATPPIGNDQVLDCLVCTGAEDDQAMENGGD